MAKLQLGPIKVMVKVVQPAQQHMLNDSFVVRIIGREKLFYLFIICVQKKKKEDSFEVLNHKNNAWMKNSLQRSRNIYKLASEPKIAG